MKAALHLPPVRLPNLFYGWWIVIAGAAGMALSAGLNFYGFSAFFVPLTQEFGWNRTALSGVYSFSRLESGILGPVEGFLVDKLGPRIMMLVGVPLMAAGFILLSQVHSLATLYLVYILFITLGSGLAFSTPISATVANWFQRKRSLAFGIMWSGVGLGGATMVPMVSWLIVTSGWRVAAVVSGILIFVVGLPIALVVRHRPERYGYLPDGGPSDRPTERGGGHRGEQRATTPAGQEEDMTARQALRTRAFWLLAVAVGLRHVVTTGFLIHLIPMLTDRGISITVAGSMLGSVALLSITGRMGLAWLGDRFSKTLLMSLATGLMGLTMLGMSGVTSTWGIVLLLVAYAMSYGGLTVLPLPLQADLFGRGAFATIRGFLGVVQTGGGLAGPLIAGFVYDTTQSYSNAFLAFAAAAFLSAVTILLVRKPRAAHPRPASASAG
ncbi:MAG: MFS transporter [Chloroflexi bacterium]|nr:MFS transporter [Chloroflexota bacterium]